MTHARRKLRFAYFRLAPKMRSAMLLRLFPLETVPWFLVGSLMNYF